MICSLIHKTQKSGSKENEKENKDIVVGGDIDYNVLVLLFLLLLMQSVTIINNASLLHAVAFMQQE